MGENIDVRMENYMKLLTNAEFCKFLQLDEETMMAMKQSVAIYAATTSKKFVDDYNKAMKQQETQEEVRKLFN